MSKQPSIDASLFVAPACLVAPDLYKRSPQYHIAHVQHFKELKADSPVWDKAINHEANKSSFDTTKVLLLSRRKKEKLNERDAFSDEEYSDEEDSEYEQVVTPKKNQRAKRKRGANEEASFKRIKPNPNFKPQRN